MHPSQVMTSTGKSKLTAGKTNIAISGTTKRKQASSGMVVNSGEPHSAGLKTNKTATRVQNQKVHLQQA